MNLQKKEEPLTEREPEGLARSEPPLPSAASAGPVRAPFLGPGVSGLVLALCVLTLAVHAVDSWAAANSPALHGLIMWSGTLVTAPDMLPRPPPEAPLAGLSPYILHVFVHAGWWHVLLNMGILLAAGSAAAAPFGRGVSAAAGFLAFYFTCAIAGAGLHALVHINEPTFMVGASTAVSGVFAAAGWASGGRTGMLRLAVPWLLINALIAIGGIFYSIPIAWAGHVGGLLAGMLLYPVFVRVFRRG
ncbi:rhomboid family protein [Glycocaulis alkaliphilus]|uniref:Rhomboid family protein n=1 Tax=Glycocaulis alkaliphilus TaxID=1434191 RepID=A0A3T0EBV9_9PROT|nr:rhomboid family protein [Glycocaulis alkaliphilus]